MARRTTTEPAALVPVVAKQGDDLVSGPLELNARFLAVRPGELIDFDGWAATGVWLETAHGAIQWWLGDWLLLGEARFGEAHAQALPELGVEPETLEQYAWLARNIPPSRRLFNLPWSVYRVVGALPEAEQRRWLERAERGNADGRPWTAAELRSAMASEAGVALEQWVLVRCANEEDRRAFMEATSVAGRSCKAVDKKIAEHTA